MESRGRGSRSNSAGMTLNTMLSDKRGSIRPGEEQFPRVYSNRTLSDIIRDESGGTTHYYTGKKSWRHFKDKLRRRRGAAWTSTFSTPASDIPINNRSMNRRPSGGFPSDMAHQVDISAVPDVDPELMSNPRNRPSLQRNASCAMERASGRSDAHSLGMRRLQREDNSGEDENDDDDDDDEEEEHESEEGESGSDEEDSGQQPVRMSLMSLLAETDREMGLDGSSYMLDDDDDDEDEDEDGDGDGGEYNSCCVCMVRHKGAAFVPCGHSFCRLCSKELWAQRGNCPLCNNYILEILDIF